MMENQTRADKQKIAAFNAVIMTKDIMYTERSEWEEELRRLFYTQLQNCLQTMTIIDLKMYALRVTLYVFCVGT